MNLQTILIQQLVSALVVMMSPEILKKGLDGLLDTIEEAVGKTENTVDDIVVLGICQQIRRAFDVPDND
ncbi:MAG: hypothetical protein EOM10_09890 [Opitutae bacterium]|jgi:hypothetical protein|nr:hypothetical protein [Opitutae bacterium]